MEEECNGCMNRRDLITTIAAVGGAFALTGSIEQSDAAMKWVVIGKAAEVKEVPKLFHVHDKSIYVFRDEKHKLHAISGICTHKGCTVDWYQPTHDFVCPCHGAVYTLMGKNVKGPARLPLVSIPVDEVKGKLRVDMNAVMKLHMP